MESCDCWNDSCGGNSAVYLNQGYYFIPSKTIPVYGEVLNISDNCSELSLSNDTEVQFGRIIEVRSYKKHGFGYWHAPGTLMDGSDYEIDNFTHINGNQAIQPMTNWTFIDVYPQGNTINWPQGQDAFIIEDIAGSNGIFKRIWGAKHEILTLSAEPSDACASCTSVSWSTDLGGFTLNSAVSIPMGSGFCKLFCNGLPPVPNNTQIVAFTAASSEGGVATVAANGNSNSTIFLGSASQYQTINPKSFTDPSFKAVPKIGWGTFATSSSGETYNNRYIGSAFYYAIFERCPSLEIKIAVIDPPDGSGPECAGYCSVANAKKYYPLPYREGMPYPDPEVVKIEAIPRSGYKFIGWRGYGMAYTSASGSNTSWQVVPQSGQDINIINDSTIWIEMCNPENRRESIKRQITAVFEPIGGMFILYVDPPLNNHCYCYDPFSSEAFGHTKWKIIYNNGCGCKPKEILYYNNFIDIMIGFWPYVEASFTNPCDPPRFLVPDNEHKNSKPKEFGLRYSNVLSALNETLSQYNDSTDYCFYNRNCTTVALDVLRAAGIDTCTDKLCPGTLYECLFKKNGC